MCRRSSGSLKGGTPASAALGQMLRVVTLAKQHLIIATTKKRANFHSSLGKSCQNGPAIRKTFTVELNGLITVRGPAATAGERGRLAAGDGADKMASLPTAELPELRRVRLSQRQQKRWRERTQLPSANFLEPREKKHAQIDAGI